MSTMDWAMLLRPFIALVFLAIVCIPVRMAAERWLPPGRIRRILLWRIPGHKSSAK